MSPSLQIAIAFLLGTAAAAHAPAGIDLSRVTPVPGDRPVPIEDFFRPNLVEEPDINPSGTRIAALISAGEDKHDLFIEDIETGATDSVSEAGDRDVYYVSWVNDARVIFGLSGNKHLGIGVLAGEFGNLKHSYPLLQYFGTRMITVPRVDRMHPLVWNKYDFDTGRDRGAEVISTDDLGARVFDLFRADVTPAEMRASRDNSERHIEKSFPMPNVGVTYGYMADSEGELAFAFVSDDGVPALMRLEERKWVRCPIDLERNQVLGPGEQSGTVILFARGPDGRTGALEYMDAATGAPGKILVQDDTYDFDGQVLPHPLSGKIVGVKYNREKPRAIWSNPVFRGLQEKLDAKFPGLFVEILDCDDATKRFVFSTFSDRQPPVYYWIDVEQGKPVPFRSAAPWIDPERMRPMEVLKFATRDGRELDSYLTMPAPDANDATPPLVVLLHGGPWTVRDTWEFDGEAQFLASRGYAVLQINYRGSYGYDWRFPIGDRWDFVKMQQDVTDATRAVIASGRIDRDRVAIMGGSFGGFLALQGVVEEPGLYRCAVAVAAVSDWAQHVKDKRSDRFENPAYGVFLNHLGDPRKERAKFEAISPARHADRIRVPVFVAAGKEDYVVDYSQSKRLIAALRKNKVPCESYIVGGEGHGMGHLDSQVELYGRIEKFLVKNLAKRN